MTALPPVGVCTKCGDFTYDAARINGNCRRQRGGKRCRGVYGSALNRTIGRLAGSCNGAGRISGAICSVCQGSGWRYVRRST
jgi:hypothetical protein